MQKDASYFQSAITYNEELEKRASELAEEVEHEVIKGWCRAVAKQHAFHLARHRQALKNFNKAPQSDVGTADPVREQLEEQLDEISTFHPDDSEVVEPTETEAPKATGDARQPFKVTETVVSQGEGNLHIVEAVTETSEPPSMSMARVQHIHAENDPCGPGCPVFAEEESK